MSNAAPVLLVVDDDPLQHDLVRALLEPAGWKVLSAASGRAALTVANDHHPALILMDLQMEGIDGEETARLLRAGGPAVASIPILAYSATRSTGDGRDPPDHMDGIVDKAGGASALAQTIDAWRPASLDGPRRIAAALGLPAIQAMVDRLADRLRDALDQLHHGAFDVAEAHRLAGLCGTLGFADAHRAWLAVSEADDSALADARRATRLTLAAITTRI